MGAYKPPLEGRHPERNLLLDFNERTLPVAECVQKALIDYIAKGLIQMYPSYGDTVEKIGAYCSVPSDQIMLTNGSDQGIDLIFRAACREGDEAIIPGPGFAMYNQCAGIENLNIISPQYRRETGFPTEGVLDALSPKTKIICIANPNNPCGTVISREDIVQILKAAPEAAVLVDECYFEYAGETVADLVDIYPNLLITRTFSKTWGMPSLRLGYVISSAENIRALLNVRGPYDVNQLAIVAVRAALLVPEQTLDYVNEVMQQSKPFFEGFLLKEGIEFWPSGANFIWVFVDNPNAIQQYLQSHQILVRPKQDADGRTGLRITLGTLEQTQHLVDVLTRALGLSEVE